MFDIWFLLLNTCLIKNFESKASLIDSSFLQVKTFGLINLSSLHDFSFLMCPSEIGLSSFLLSHGSKVSGTLSPFNCIGCSGS